MANALNELSQSLREAIRKASAYTVGLEREPYAVSGVLIGGDKVLTASHLVPDEGVDVLMPDGKRLLAKVAGRDPINDLALLKVGSGIQAPTPPTASVGVGDLVVTLKRDSFDGINAAMGMVSAAGEKLRLGRTAFLERYVQTDDDRMTGSTGGPVVDAEGAFAGIQVFNRRMGAEVVIPADIALARAKLLEEKGSVQRPYLGVKSQPVSLSKTAGDAVKGRQDSGLLIVWVEKESPAEQAGVEVGDILVGFAGSPVRNHEELVIVMAGLGAGAKADTELIRAGTLRTVSLTLGGT